MARRLVGSREEAEDLMQETYARAFRAGSRTRRGRTCAPTLRILTNLNIDRGRRKQLRPRCSRSRKATTSSTTSSRSRRASPLRPGRVVERLSQDDVVSALSAVPHDFRDVVVLVDIGDFTYQDAAQILDIPIGTVMSRLHRGRRILKSAPSPSRRSEE